MFEIVGITRCMCRGIAQTINRPDYFDLRQPINKEGFVLFAGMRNVFNFCKENKVTPPNKVTPFYGIYFSTSSLLFIIHRFFVIK